LVARDDEHRLALALEVKVHRRNARAPDAHVGAEMGADDHGAFFTGLELEQPGSIVEPYFEPKGALQEIWQRGVFGEVHKRVLR